MRGVLSELKDHCPSLTGLSDRKLRKLLLAVRRRETYPVTATRRGRPANFDWEMLEEVSQRMKATLERETGGRISVQTFVLEAAHVARITASRLGVKEREAKMIREEIVANHLRAQGSQTRFERRCARLWAN